MKMQRENFLDILRIIAALAVVAFHVMKSSVSNDPAASEQVRVIIGSAAAVLEWHVPVFFMITGYLWLNDNKTCTFSNVLGNIKRFVLVLFTIGFAYAAMERIFDSRHISTTLIIGAFIDVLNGKLWDHMWYLYSIIGVYLFLPVVKPFFAKQSLNEIGALVGILFVSTIFMPVVEAMSNYRFPINYPIITPAFYVCMGGFLSHVRKPTRKESFGALVLFIISGAMVFAAKIKGTLFVHADSVLISVCAVSLFIAVAGLFESGEGNEFIRLISSCTFGIYLFHPFFINLMMKLFHIYPLSYFAPLSLFLMFVGVIVCAFLLTVLLRKIPFLRKGLL